MSKTISKKRYLVLVAGQVVARFKIKVKSYGYSLKAKPLAGGGKFKVKVPATEPISIETLWAKMGFDSPEEGLTFQEVADY